VKEDSNAEEGGGEDGNKQSPGGEQYTREHKLHNAALKRETRFLGGGKHKKDQKLKLRFHAIPCRALGTR